MSTEIILSSAPKLPARAPVHAHADVGTAYGGILHQINNDNERKAYLNATRRFAEWCDARGIGQLGDVQSLPLAAQRKVGVSTPV